MDKIPKFDGFGAVVPHFGIKKMWNWGNVSHL